MHINLETLEHGTKQDSYSKNAKWTLAELGMSKKSDRNNSLTLNVKLQRRDGMIMTTIVSPVMILAEINCFVWLVQCGTAEKLSLILTIYLSYGVFILSLAIEMPYNGIRVSLMSQFIIICMFFSGFAALWTLVSPYLSQRLTNNRIDPSSENESRV